MSVALDAGLDLAGLLGCLLLIGLLAVVGYTFTRLADVLDFSVLGVRPLAGVGHAIEQTIVRGCNAGVKALERQTAKFLSGLIDVFGLVLAIPLLIASGVKGLIGYLWTHALAARIESAVGVVRSTAQGADALARRIERDIYAVEVALPRKIAAAVEAGVTRAERFTVSRVDDGLASIRRTIAADIATVERDIRAALATAEQYADRAVTQLQRTETAAVDAVRAEAAAQLRDAIRRVETEVSAVRSDLGAELTAARHDLTAAIEQATATATAEAEHVRQQAQAALDDAIRTGQAALDRVRGELTTATQDAEALAGRIGHDLGTIEGTLGLAGTAAAIAAVPALVTLVQAIATEAGLDNPSCRGKVKQICATDPAAWEGLLGGLAAVGMTLDFRDLVDTGRELLHGLAAGGDAFGLPT